MLMSRPAFLLMTGSKFVRGGAGYAGAAYKAKNPQAFRKEA